MVEQKSNYPSSIGGVLKEMRGHKADLLRVLERPEVPLHNNGSESIIRGYVKTRKISGSTRSDAGQRGATLPRHIRECEEDLPETGSEFLGVSVRSGARAGTDCSAGGHDSAEDPGDSSLPRADRDARGSYGRRGGMTGIDAARSEARPTCCWAVLAFPCAPPSSIQRF